MLNLAKLNSQKYRMNKYLLEKKAKDDIIEVLKSKFDSFIDRYLFGNNKGNILFRSEVTQLY